MEKSTPGTGELLAFGYQFASPHLTFYRIGRAGRVVERRAIDLSTPCLMHDFAVTERHAVFFDTPAVMVQDWGGGGLPFRWQEGRGTRLGVVPLRGGEVRWFELPASRSPPTPPSMTGGCSRCAMTANWIGATSSSSTRTSSAAIRWPSCSCRGGCPLGPTGAGWRTDAGALAARTGRPLAEPTAAADR